jgi:hypothetical protein
MKALLLILGVILGASQASALTCTDVNAGPDHGYLLKFSKNLGRVTVSQETIAGPIGKRQLTCRKIHSGPNGPDQIYPILTCRQPGLFDAGYTLIVEQGGLAGLVTASLFETSIAGAEEVASFICKKK